ncbi:MAG: 30S ribosomal protein S13 [Candidatus Pacebacteria bacterium]|nr:30S ribosomal protein S13 [Candidatus Paceibacterota bacterium]
MIRISGVVLSDKKKLATGLTAIYGIGHFRSLEILEKTGIADQKRVEDLTADEVLKLQKAVDELVVEGVLKKKINQDIDRLKSINSYRGLRHSQNLPVRGQRTRSNARTGRGRRLTVGAMKKEALAKIEATKKKKEV